MSGGIGYIETVSELKRYRELGTVEQLTLACKENNSKQFDNSIFEFLRYYDEVSTLLSMSLDFYKLPKSCTVSICTLSIGESCGETTEIVSVVGEDENLVFARAQIELQKWVENNIPT